MLVLNWLLRPGGSYVTKDNGNWNIKGLTDDFTGIQPFDDKVDNLSI